MKKNVAAKEQQAPPAMAQRAQRTLEEQRAVDRRVAMEWKRQLREEEKDLHTHTGAPKAKPLEQWQIDMINAEGPETEEEEARYGAMLTPEEREEWERIDAEIARRMADRAKARAETEAAKGKDK